MWMTPPVLQCDKHLLGEHGEIHKFKPSFEKKYSIDGRMNPIVQIEPAKMADRHDELAKEMLRREFNHKSPYTLPDLSYLPPCHLEVKVNKLYNIWDMWERCQNCRNRIYIVVNKSIKVIMETFDLSYDDAYALQRELSEILKGSVR